ncbi:MAG: glycosyltransferase family 2 protein [Kiritimatiellaeota bacterium]|nr:glycosyltransferase family 2 protein [Kiritimatiellota bacterium]
MIPCSVYMVVCNEEKHLARALESVREFAEVIVVDSGSADATCAMAESYPNVRLLRHAWEGYAPQKQWALNHCTNAWAFNIDADEEVSPALRDVIAATIAEGKADAVRFPIPDVFLGTVCGLKVTDKIRCFRKGTGRYDLTNLVHEQILFSGTSAVTKAPLLHYGLTSIAKAIEKQNAYSSLKAREKFAKGKRASLVKLVLIFPVTWFASYFLKGSFRNGVAGFVNATNAAYYAFCKEAKLYELNGTPC